MKVLFFSNMLAQRLGAQRLSYFLKKNRSLSIFLNKKNKKTPIILKKSFFKKLFKKNEFICCKKNLEG
jgi:hypothetical protein